MRSATRLPAVSSTSGTGDVLDQLQQDHRRVEGLFAQASTTSGATREAVIGEIVRELSVHAAVEEQVVYPAMASTIAGAEGPTDQSLDEHQEIKKLLVRLDKAEADDPGVVEALRQLQLVVQAHVMVEEAQMFPAFRRSAIPGALADLGRAAEEARVAAPTRAHPHAPNTPPGNVVAGAVAGIVDAVRDAVSGRDEPDGTTR